MSVYRTRRVRNLAAVLMLLSGVTHISQLWYRETDGVALFTAMTGMVYLLLGLGLSGQSRFALLASSFAVIANGVANGTTLSTSAIDPLLWWHVCIDATVAVLCLYILYATRSDVMD